MGFEVMYWLPFLEHLIARYKIDRSRLIAVTRGGAGAWYGAGTSVELYDYVPPRDVRLQALQSSKDAHSIKQLVVTAWERTLIALLAERLVVRRYHVLHPSRMYRTLDGY